MTVGLLVTAVMVVLVFGGVMILAIRWWDNRHPSEEESILRSFGEPHVHFRPGFVIVHAHRKGFSEHSHDAKQEAN